MESLIYKKEKDRFIIALVISSIFYLLMIISLVGIIYLGIIALAFLISHGLFIGSIRGNAILVSEKQFPEVHRIATEISNKMELTPIPTIYILQAGGLLNAFATKFLGRNFVVIYSDVLELAYQKGEDELAFIIAHELAHIKRKHLTNRWFILPAMLIPFLGTAYSRACEYTCDQFGAYYKPKGALTGLLVLAAGKSLYKSVDVQEFMDQSNNDNSFWIRFSELLSTHPNLPKRIKSLTSFMSEKPIAN